MIRCPQFGRQSIFGVSQYDDSLLTLYKPLISGNDEQIAFNEFLPILQAYRASRDNLIELALSGRKEDALEIIYGAGRTKSDEVFVRLRNLIRINREQAEVFEKQTVQRGQMVTILMAVVSLLSIIVAIGAGRLLNYCINSPLREITDKANKVAKGDIDNR